jgi:hypothetical protein
MLLARTIELAIQIISLLPRMAFWLMAAAKFVQARTQADKLAQTFILLLVCDS